jgi:hypothetical protein
MNSIQLPKHFVKYLLELKPIFTKPSFEYFKVLILGILLGRPKKTVTAAIKIANLEKQFSNVNRFVSQYIWDVWKLGIAVLKLVIKTLNLQSKTLTIAIDSTLLSKFGTKIFGCAYHYNSAQKNNLSKYVWGHEWFVMGLVHFSKLFNKWLCFPFLAQLFVPQKYLPEDREYKSTIELAVDMVRYVKDNIKQKLILVADGYFAKTRLLKTCCELKIPVISRLQSNAALYQSSIPKPTKRRGRPRKYGKRFASLSTLAKREKGFSDLTIKLYGKKRQIRVKRIDAIWKPAGQIIQILIVYYENGKKPAFFFCTDLGFSVEDILTRVAARWSLENIFKDLKEHLGWSHWQCRVEEAVTRSATLTCAAASLLVLWSHKEASQKQPELWDTLPWYTQKVTPSINDMIEHLRCRTLDLSFNAIHYSRKTMVEKVRAYRKLFKLAA